MLDPVYETVRRVRAALPAETALIGFAGAPWTVATYMVEGGSSRDFPRVKAWAYRDPAGFAALIDLIDEATIDFLVRADRGGGRCRAVVRQLGRGIVAEADFARWVIEPTRRIVGGAEERVSRMCPVIGFPRGAGLLYERYAAETGVDAVGLDTAVPIGFARERSCKAGCRCRAISIRCCCWSAAPR